MSHFCKTYMTPVTGLALFIFSYVMMFQNPFFVGYDLSGYLSIAKNFANGAGMVDSAGELSMHRMGYKLFLAGLLKLSPEHTLYALAATQSLFGAFFVLGIFTLGKKLYSASVGIAASVLFLSSLYVVSSLPPRGLDLVWATLIFWSLIFYLDEGEGKARRLGLGLIAGLLTAAAFWIKEMGALFFLPVPVLLYIAGVRPTGKILPFYGASMVGIALGGLLYWAIQKSSAGLSSDLVAEGSAIKSAASTMMTLYSDNQLISTIMFAADGVRRYLFNDISLSVAYPIIYIVPVALLYMIARVFTKSETRENKTADKIILLMALSYLPFIIWAGAWNMRVVAILPVLAILLIASTALMFRLLKTFPLGAWVLVGAFLAMELAMSYPCCVAEGKVKRIFGNQNPASFSAAMFGQEFKGWLEDHLREDENIMVSDVVIRNGIDASRDLPYKVFLGPYEKQAPGLEENAYIPWTEKGKRYDLAILRHSPNNMRMGEIYFVSTQDLKKTISERNIRYMILSNQVTDNLLNEWLHYHNNIRDFKLPKEFMSELKFYNIGLDDDGLETREEVIDSGADIDVVEFLPEFKDESSPSGCFVDKNLMAYLEKMKEEAPRLFDRYKSLITEKLGMTDEQFSTMLDAGFCVRN